MKTGDVLKLWLLTGEGGGGPEVRRDQNEEISRSSSEENPYFHERYHSLSENIKVIIDEKKSGTYTLASIAEPYTRYRLRDDGRIDSFEVVGKNSFFEIEEISRDEIYIKGTIKSKDTTSTLYLYPHNGALLSSSSPTIIKFEIEKLSIVSLAAIPNEYPPLDAWLKRRFVHEGYLHIPNGVSKSKVEKCQRLLMHNLGIPGAIVAGGAQEGLGKLAGSLSNSVEVRELLLGEKILSIIGNLMGGQKNIDCVTNLSAQIALRFPELSCDQRIKWHTDGLRQGKTHGFSLLVGVCLSNVVEEDSGNLLVWPGTHVPIHEATVGNEGSIDIARLTSLLHSHRLSPPSLTEVDFQPVEIEHHNNDPENLPSLGQPYQLLSQVGDVVILHPDTAHTGGPNYSCSIRSMVYFRIKHRNLKDHDSFYRENMWIDLPGVFEYS